MPPKKAASKSLAARYASSDDDQEVEDYVVVEESTKKPTKPVPRAAKKQNVKPIEATQEPSQSDVDSTITEEAPPKPKPRGRNSKKTNQVDLEDEMDVDEEEVASKKVTKKAPVVKATSKPKESVKASNPSTTAAEKPPPKPRGRPKKAEAPVADDSLLVLETQPNPVISEPKKTNTEKPRARTATKPATKKVQEPSEVEKGLSEEELPSKPKPGRKPVKASSVNKKDESVHEETEEEEEVVVKQAKPAKRGRTAKPITKKVDDVPSVDEGSEIEDVKKTKTGKGEKAAKHRKQTSVDEDEDPMELDPAPSKTKKPIVARHRSPESEEDVNDQDDLVKQYEKLQLDHASLVNLRETEAEKHVKELQIQIVELEKNHKKKIATVEAQMAKIKAQASSKPDHSKELLSLQEDLKTRDERIKTLSVERQQALDNVAKLERSTDVLVAKLENSRNAAKTPNGIGTKNLSSLKEELYADLSGLIIRGAHETGDKSGIVYDCIQAGKNGSIHYKLEVDNMDNSSGAGAASSYEEANFSYTPKLDEARDSALMAILPEFLKEEISFPRAHAIGFYARLSKVLSERVEYHDEDEELEE